MKIEHWEWFQEFKKTHPLKDLLIRDERWQYLLCGKEQATNLVLCHGAFVDPYLWSYPIEKLETNFRILAPWFKMEKSIDEQCQAIVKMMNEENMEKAIVIGISYGGGLAQRFVRMFPEKTQHLVLTHTSFPTLERAKKIRKTIGLMRLLPWFVLRRFFRKRWRYFPEDNPRSDFAKKYLSSFSGDLTKKQIIQQMKIMITFEPEEYSFEKLTSWSGKTIILNSKDDTDTYYKVAFLREHYSKISEVLVHIFEKGGHHIVLLYPEEYTKVLEQFLMQLE